ncbi:hypothetical protein LCL96_00305 [Rossellomorea aquimaris]|uniref:hypothetical protein n=1 Tax=Rossellomorea aquimaris TaxID=189382 RepID=UPI001CD5E69A|nr:hypothetical protein [Rossellomorea aquimaris]MCA1057354.1 hypothetical protein [Rossellomorea aquimaris]
MSYVAIGRIIQVYNERYPHHTFLYMISDKGEDELEKGRISLKSAVELMVNEKICNIYAPQ